MRLHAYAPNNPLTQHEWVYTDHLSFSDSQISMVQCYDSNPYVLCSMCVSIRRGEYQRKRAISEEESEAEAETFLCFVSQKDECGEIWCMDIDNDGNR